MLALLGAVLLLVLFSGAGSASAHAALKGTDPADGSVVKSAPRHVTLTFTESVSLLDDSFRLLDPDGRGIRTGEPRHADGDSATARVTLPEGLGTGTFTVAWRVVSADSHPVSGAFTFSIGAPSPTSAVLPAAPVGDTVSSTLYDIARYVAYGGLALLIGAGTFVLVCGVPGAPRRLLVTGWWALLLSTVALLLLRGPYERGSGPADAFDPSVLGGTLTSRPGAMLLARLVLLAAAVALHRVQSRTPGAGPAVTVPGGVLAVGLAVTWAAAEHASAGIQVPVAVASSVLHLLAMAVWLGGLAALLTALYRSPEPLPASAVARFSRAALASVTVLVLTGVYQSWRGLGSWGALTSTSYGRILLAKLAAVLILLAAAGYSRRWTGRLPGAEARVSEPVAVPVPATVAGVRERTGGPVGGEPGEPGSPAAAADTGSDAGPAPEGAADGREDRPGDAHRRALRRSVLAEVAVGAVVLLLTTVLTGTVPGRAENETVAASKASAADVPASSAVLAPFTVGTPGTRGKVQIELAPGRVGENAVQALVLGPDGGITTVPELRLRFSLPERRLGPIDAGLTDQGGYWGTDAVTLPVAGTWTMKVTVRTTDIDQVTVSRKIRIG
ncbi:copper resistance CopC/CopD family protein [Streptomyces sp. NPDC008313]|uniref:copper resistance CopC/CopD family protein n=1 Tax=Streptomyces sp. NPDC008313 TaxID=3364826 RepID=UPI0036F15F3C